MERVCSKAAWHDKGSLHPLTHSINLSALHHWNERRAFMWGLTLGFLLGADYSDCATWIINSQQYWYAEGKFKICPVELQSKCLSTARSSPRVTNTDLWETDAPQLHQHLTYSMMQSVCWFTLALHHHKAHITHSPIVTTERTSSRKGQQLGMVVGLEREVEQGDFDLSDPTITVNTLPPLPSA